VLWLGGGLQGPVAFWESSDVMPTKDAHHGLILRWIAMDRPLMRWLSTKGLALLLLALGAGVTSPLRAQAQTAASRCDGTLLEVRGDAEQQRATQRLRFSLGLDAEAGTADGALRELQGRLAALRQILLGFQVQDLRVTSPSTWQRPAERDRPALVQASLQVQGLLAPGRLQLLIRQVGALQGVRLAPVVAEADQSVNRQARQRLLRAGYQDALVQAREIAAAVGLGRVRPIEVQLDSGGPVMMRAMAEPSVPSFDPAELPQPTDRISLRVRFCAS